MKFRVRSYYLASGMEGHAAEADYGDVDAESARDACDLVAIREYPVDTMRGPNKSWSTRQFFRDCLYAKVEVA